MNAKLPGSGFGSFDCTIRLGKGGRSPDVDIPQANPPQLSPPSPHPASRERGETGTGHMCKLSPSPPSLTVSSHSLLQTDKPPLWLDTHCKLSAHYAAHTISKDRSFSSKHVFGKFSNVISDGGWHIMSKLWHLWAKREVLGGFEDRANQLKA